MYNETGFPGENTAKTICTQFTTSAYSYVLNDKIKGF